jgi:hypothetical protein
MKIAILELMDQGHFTLVESIIEIFLSDKKNLITVYGNAQGFQNIKSIDNDRLTKNIINSPKSKLEILKEINQLSFDKIIITTLDKYLVDFSKMHFNSPTYLFIHNINLWFEKSNLYSKIRLFITDSLNNKSNFKYLIKYHLIYPIYYNKIKQNIIKSNGKFCVLNNNMRQSLNKFIDNKFIIEIPFSIYNSSNCSKKENKLLTIALPGMVSKVRRDYLSIFEQIEKNEVFYRENISFILLGGISKLENGNEIIQKAEELNSRNQNLILFNKEFVNIDEFDAFLNKSDLILSNLHVKINSSTIYGETKESGVMFSMIKFAIPGISPLQYKIMKELETSILKFKDYDELTTILKDLIINPNKIEDLKNNAIKNSLNFAPEKIYNQIIKCL